MTQVNEAKADWLNTVAHDLKTPINSVRGCIELVQQLGPLNERQKHFADKAMTGLQRMEHLVARLLEISWIDAEMALSLMDCDLGMIIREVVDLLRPSAERRQITIQLDLDPKLGMIIADMQRITQVVDNLVSNAVKYNLDGGQVWIKAIRQEDRVLLSVRDSGIGISPEDQPHVFERFFRSREGVARKIEGSGLGLAITKAIVQKHGGRIWLESKPKLDGTMFYVALPLQNAVSEGGERLAEARHEVGEGAERRETRQVPSASEERDAISDDSQETREMPVDDPSNGDDR
ncbi:MAG: HAMP domain-containing histidine kinase [Chloroflexi bacterium]|nr:HAMP domain-containing histidine kinase [Chloroflexota bacterium]